MLQIKHFYLVLFDWNWPSNKRVLVNFCVQNEENGQQVSMWIGAKLTLNVVKYSTLLLIQFTYCYLYTGAKYTKKSLIL